jgi:hypothetical protein
MFLSDSSEVNIIIGFCSYCNHMQSYEALVMSGTNDPMCQYCFQEGNSCNYVINTYVYMSPVALYIKSLKIIYDRQFLD